MQRLLHVLSGLEVGGKERVVLDLATRARRAGLDHRLGLFDTPFRDPEIDLDPGDVPVTFLPRGPGLDWRFTGALARHVASEGIEVLHAHNDTALFYCAAAGWRLGRRRPRIVATFHTRPWHDTRGARWLAHWASRRVDAVTAVSSDLARFLESAGWTRRCETLWNGVDVERFTPQGPVAAPDGPDDHPRVAHIGRLDPIKRHVDLLEAFRGVQRAVPGASLTLVGDGPLRPEIERACAGTPGVRLVPRVHDVAAFLRGIDVLVLCSEMEAAPCVVLEALACGRPVVATDVGGVRELLSAADGPCGLLVPARDPVALAAVLVELLESPGRRDDLGRRGRRRALDFSADAAWKRYLELWRG